jgi:hypothetical protein
VTLEGATEDERTLEVIAETTKHKRTLRFKGRLKHAPKIGIVVIWRLESSKSKGLQAHWRGYLSPHDEVKARGYIVEFDANNKREDNLGFWLELK